MKRFRDLCFMLVLFALALIIAFYSYAYFDTLSLDEERKNITIYDSNREVIYESNFKKSMEWTSLSQIPDFVQKAFINVEDKRFYYHAGFDPIRIVKALGTNILHGNILEGGSTITQQYAKNLFLSNDQTITRKVKEFCYAARLEMQYSKEDILEGYLNTIYFGHGIYGVKAAADYFFDQSLEDLSIAQCAMLIGIPNGPSIYSPFLHEDNAIARQQLILDVLETNDIITDQQKQEAQKEKLILSDKSKSHTAGNNAYYINAVMDELSQLSIDIDQPLHVYTYYDPSIQNDLDTAIKRYTSIEDELEVAGVIVQPFSGNVMAMAGGKDYTISQFNRALYSSRQVASTIKPLLYYCALVEGFTPATQFLSQKTTFQLADGEVYSPTNYNDIYANANISMINAISLSDNIYAVKTHLFLGEDTLHRALLHFNITSSQPNPSEALGTVNMSLMELSSIYNTFASEGLYISPSMVDHITSDNEVIYARDTQMKRLLERDETLILNQMLTSTFDIRNLSFTFPSMYGYQPNVRVAAKSGTSDWDSLVMGFTPEYTVGIWSGFDDNRLLGKEYYLISKHIFQDTFNALYKDRDGVWYKPSDNIIEKHVDPITGEEDANGSLYWFKEE